MTTTTGFPHLPVSAAKSRAVETTRAVFAGLFERHGPRGFAIRLWDGETLAGGGGPLTHFTLVLTHPGALRRMLLPPGELALAEA